MSALRRLFGLDSPEPNLRIIITRHGERADLALGPRWVNRYRANGSQDPRISYLTPRENFYEWTFDSPLTVTGERQSMSIGRKLLQLNCPIDYCYSSPAYRSVQTANRILEGQGRQGVPINIEPGLFECASWYAEGPLSFIPPESLARDRHFNVNPYYSPIQGSVDPTEDEHRYFKRSRQVIDAIIKAHKSQGGTILLSGHGGSIEAVARGLVRGPARPEYLQRKANRVNYCDFALLERDGRTKKWSVHLPRSLENPHGGMQPILSSIPLYSITTANPLRVKSSRDTYPRRYRHR